MYFEYPLLLLLLAVPALMVLHYLYLELKGRNPHVRVSTIQPWKASGFSIMSILRHVPFILRIIALTLIVICIARPRSCTQLERIDAEGIDIVLAMDVSGSMEINDFEPNRLEAAKDIAIKFIADRPSDRMGIVVFAGESYTQCPLTTNRAALINLMKELKSGLIEDGTAIGSGLATSVLRLKDSDAKSKVVILLTDGVNNRFEMQPEMAVDLAKTYGIRVYTIGVGKNGLVTAPVMTPWGIEYQQVQAEVDEDLLKEIAEQTGGTYFRAEDNAKLAEIYDKINEMEKIRIEGTMFPVYKELFMNFAIFALAALLLEAILAAFIRRLP